MKKQILIAIAALIGSGTYISLNALEADHDCVNHREPTFTTTANHENDGSSVQPDTERSRRLKADDDCGITGRRVFDGAERTVDRRENRPSVRPETENSIQPRFTSFNEGTAVAVAPTLQPSRLNETNGKSSCDWACRESRSRNGSALRWTGLGLGALGVLFLSSALNGNAVVSALMLAGFGLVLLGLILLIKGPDIVATLDS